MPCACAPVFLIRHQGKYVRIIPDRLVVGQPPILVSRRCRRRQPCRCSASAVPRSPVKVDMGDGPSTSTVRPTSAAASATAYILSLFHPPPREAFARAPPKFISLCVRRINQIHALTRSPENNALAVFQITLVVVHLQRPATIHLVANFSSTHFVCMWVGFVGCSFIRNYKLATAGWPSPKRAVPGPKSIARRRRHRLARLSIAQSHFNRHNHRRVGFRECEQPLKRNRYRLASAVTFSSLGAAESIVAPSGIIPSDSADFQMRLFGLLSVFCSVFISDRELCVLF